MHIKFSSPSEMNKVESFISSIIANTPFSKDCQCTASHERMLHTSSECSRRLERLDSLLFKDRIPHVFNGPKGPHPLALGSPSTPTSRSINRVNDSELQLSHHKKKPSGSSSVELRYVETTART